MTEKGSGGNNENETAGMPVEEPEADNKVGQKDETAGAGATIKTPNKEPAQEGNMKAPTCPSTCYSSSGGSSSSGSKRADNR